MNLSFSSTYRVDIVRILTFQKSLHLVLGVQEGFEQIAFAMKMNTFVLSSTTCQVLAWRQARYESGR